MEPWKSDDIIAQLTLEVWKLGLEGKTYPSWSLSYLEPKTRL